VVPLKKSGVPTSPLDGVTVILIHHQIFQVFCYVSQMMGGTNPNNIVISVLDIGKGCYSLP
jgi:hypothetical protein